MKKGRWFLTVLCGWLATAVCAGAEALPAAAGLAPEEALSALGYAYVDTDGDGAVSTGDLVYMGVYPQTLVRDKSLLTLLAEQEGALPSADNAGDWISFGYLDNQVPSDFIFYKEVTVEGNDYRGVVTLNYRSGAGNKDNGADNSYVDDEGFETGKAYWFAYEPIAWVVLGETDDGVLVQSKYCLEAQPFQDLFELSGKERLIPGTDIPIRIGRPAR